MRNNERALIAVTNLETFGRADLRWLYGFIDASGAVLARGLSSKYAKLHELTGSAATRAGFLSAVRAACFLSRIRRVDLVLNLHGAPGRLWFADGSVATRALRRDILAIPRTSKLRLVYSTACFGDSHSADFLAAGFDAAVGSVGTNANSAVEYPIVLTMWGAGAKLRDAVSAGENPLTRIPADAAARVMGFSNVDSDKVVRGDARITIDT